MKMMVQRFKICKKSLLPEYSQYFNYQIWKPPPFRSFNKRDQCFPHWRSPRFKERKGTGNHNLPICISQQNPTHKDHLGLLKQKVSEIGSVSFIGQKEDNGDFLCWALQKEFVSLMEWFYCLCFRKSTEWHFDAITNSEMSSQSKKKRCSWTTCLMCFISLMKMFKINEDNTSTQSPRFLCHLKHVTKKKKNEG